MSLPLDSREWESLADAYGPGKFVPDWLRKLETQDPDAINELYSRICHQHSVYSSSIAALPHLVRIAKGIDDIDYRAEILALVGAICESDEFPEVLDASGENEAILPVFAEGLTLTEALLPKLQDTTVATFLLQTAAALSGSPKLSRVLEGFTNEEFCLECSGCGTELYVWPGVNELSVAAEDPVMHPATVRTIVASGPVGGPDRLAQHAWLENRVALAPGLAGIQALLPCLFGTATCPKCRTPSPLMDGLLGYFN